MTYSPQTQVVKLTHYWPLGYSLQRWSANSQSHIITYYTLNQAGFNSGVNVTE